MRRLDSLIETDKLPAPDFIKMDIEGGEVRALAGAQETLRRSRPVLLIELHNTAREVGNVLSKLDYQACLLTHRRELEAPHMLALPKERHDLREKVAAFSVPFDPEHPA